MKIDDGVIYEIPMNQFDGGQENQKYTGNEIKRVMTWYYNVIQNKNTHFIKVEGGAIIDEEMFDQLLKAIK